MEDEPLTDGTDKQSTLGLSKLAANPTKALGLGLTLLMLTFAVKLLLLDMAGTNVPTFLSVPKLMAQRQADRSDVEYEASKLRRKINRLTTESFKGAPAKQEAVRKEIDDLEKRWTKLNEENQTELLEIEKEYDDRMFKAQHTLAKASASGLSWLQMGIWTKILLDIPKIVGCLLIVFATFKLVVDPKAPGHLKTFAIVCSTVVLLMATVWSVLGLIA